MRSLFSTSALLSCLALGVAAGAFASAQQGDNSCERQLSMADRLDVLDALQPLDQTDDLRLPPKPVPSSRNLNKSVSAEQKKPTARYRIFQQGDSNPMWDHTPRQQQ